MCPSQLWKKLLVGEWKTKLDSDTGHWLDKCDAAQLCSVDLILRQETRS